MFDLSSSKLLILGIVALIVVGPKDLPILLRTIGKYVAMIRRQAAEFRSQFDDAIRESEFSTLKQDVEAMGADIERTMHDAEMEVEREIAAANADFEASLGKAPPPEFGTPEHIVAAETAPSDMARVEPSRADSAPAGSSLSDQPASVATDAPKDKVGA